MPPFMEMTCGRSGHDARPAPAADEVDDTAEPSVPERDTTAADAIDGGFDGVDDVADDEAVLLRESRLSGAMHPNKRPCTL